MSNENQQNKFDALRQRVHDYSHFIENAEYQYYPKGYMEYNLNELNPSLIKYHKELLLNYIDLMEKNNATSKLNFKDLATKLDENLHKVFIYDLIRGKETIFEWFDKHKSRNLPLTRDSECMCVFYLSYLENKSSFNYFKAFSKDTSFDKYSTIKPLWDANIQIGISFALIKYYTPIYLNNIGQDVAINGLKSKEFNDLLNSLSYDITLDRFPEQRKLKTTTSKFLLSVFTSVFDKNNPQFIDECNSFDSISSRFFRSWINIDNKFSDSAEFLDTLKTILSEVDEGEKVHILESLKSVLSSKKFLSLQSKLSSVLVTNNSEVSLFTETNSSLHMKYLKYQNIHEGVIFKNFPAIKFLKSNKNRLFKITEDFMDEEYSTLQLTTKTPLILSHDEIVDIINSFVVNPNSDNDTENQFEKELIHLNTQKERSLSLSSKLNEMDKDKPKAVRGKPKV